MTTDPQPATTPPAPGASDEPAGQPACDTAIDTAQHGELVERVHAALRAVGEGDHGAGTGSDYGNQTAAVLAALAPELAELADYRSRITWETTCGEHARLLDGAYAETVRAEAAEAALARAHTAWQSARTRAREADRRMHQALDLFDETVARVESATDRAEAAENALGGVRRLLGNAFSCLTDEPGRAARAEAALEGVRLVLAKALSCAQTWGAIDHRCGTDHIRAVEAVVEAAGPAKDTDLALTANIERSVWLQGITPELVQRLGGPEVLALARLIRNPNGMSDR